jgi:hypothetical protein
MATDLPNFESALLLSEAEAWDLHAARGVFWSAGLGAIVWFALLYAWHLA